MDFGARSTGKPRETRPVSRDMGAFLPDLSFPAVMLAERTLREKVTSMRVFRVRQRGRGDRPFRRWPPGSKTPVSRIKHSRTTPLPERRRVARACFSEKGMLPVTGSITRPRLQANSGWFLLGRRAARSPTIMPERWRTACRLTTASLSRRLSNGAPTSRANVLAPAAEALAELAGTSARTINVSALRDKFAEDDASHARGFNGIARDLRAMSLKKSETERLHEPP